MRPLHLEITAFGPYPGTVSVDFTALPSDRPFVISGPTGAGKTTLFDAMAFALYGRLPGRRSGHSEIRSDFADPATLCSVTFDFDLAGQVWRVERAPAQERPRRKGAGTTRQDHTASLHKLVGGAWQPVTSGINDVNRECRELVGLSSEQFQRVLLLPQGDFQKVLTDSSNDRTDLLRTLFGTEIYQRAVDRLKGERRDLEQRRSATTTTAETLRGQAQSHVGGARAALAGIGIATPGPVPPVAGNGASNEQGALFVLPDDGPAAPPSATGHPDGTDAVVIELRRGSPGDASPEGEPAWPCSEQPEAASPEDLADQVATLRAGPLAHARRRSAEARSAADEASARRVEAAGVAEDVARRDTLRAERAGLDASEDAHAQDAARLERADVAAGLAGAITAVDDTEQRCDRSSAALDAAWGAARDAVESAAAVDPKAPLDRTALGLDPADPVRLGEWARRCGDRSAAAATAAARRGEAESSAAEIARIDREIEDLDARQAGCRASLAATEQQAADLGEERSAVQDLASRRDDLDARHAEAVAAVRRRDDLTDAEAKVASRAAAVVACNTDLERLAAERTALLERREALVVCASQGEAHAAEAESARATRDAVHQLAGLRADLAGAEEHHRAASAALDECAKAFLAHTAPRLAATLVDEQPCPVCGSVEHPSPAVAHGVAAPVDDADLEAARAAAEAATSRFTGLTAEVGSLVARHPGVDSIDAAEAQRRVDAAEARCAEAARAQADLATCDAEVADTEREQQRLELERDTATAEQHRAELEAESLRGALGADAACPREDLARRADGRRGELDAAVRAASRLHDIDAELVASAAAAGLARDEGDRLAQRTAVLSGQRASAVERMVECRSQVAAITGGVDATALAAAWGSAQGSLGAARDAALECALARRAAADAQRRLDAEVGASLFRDAVEARAALLADEERADLQRRVREHREGRIRVASELAALEARGLPDQVPDLDALRAVAEEAAREADRIASITHEAASRLDAARDALADRDHVLAEHREEAEHLERLDRIIGVLGGERTAERLTLEAWVLAGHLREVVIAANGHLRSMTRNRYELEVDDRPRSGKGYSGLDLVVRDHHTSKLRPVASLSGGETFQASLAMALGLADVVTAGAGGRRIEALFVDEGFGSLDTDSIDQAIDVLEGLRFRGTMVGLITHVEAMKGVLPVAIEVERRTDGQGSTLRLAC
jgi:exonuclease SbcC